MNGVSQQPAPLRLSSQCELLENAYTSVVKGVQKRPPFRYLAKLTGSTFSNVHVHIINRDGLEKYAVFITNTGIQVFSLTDGSQKTVSAPSGWSYLSSAGNARSDISALTVADYTFITNRQVTCAMNTGVTAPTRPKEAMVYVRQGNYGQTYLVQINGAVFASYTTSTTSVADLDTSNIAQNLQSQLTTNLGAGWGVAWNGSVILIQNLTGGDFTIATTDGTGDKSMYAIKDVIQTFSALPQKAFDGFTVKVTGDSSNPYLGYYVRYTNNGGGVTQAGSWTECPGPGVYTTFNASTLPWQLVRNVDGTFTFQQATWLTRLVGDDKSCPIPTFIGRQINDVFFFRNRLGFVAGEKVIMSKAGNYFNFWPDTAAQVLDSDRIDVGVTHTKVSTLYAVAAYNQNLLLFSNQTQFVLSSGDILSPKTITVKPVTEFEGLPKDVKPLATGRVVYFAVPRGGFIGVREFSPLSNNFDQNDAPEITAHVPQYIPAGAFCMAASSNDFTMGLLTSGAPNAIFIYKWFYNQDNKMQSAWSKWVFDAGDTVLGIGFIQTTMYACIQRADGVYLEDCVLDVGAYDLGFSFQVRLDRLVYPTGSYNSSTNKTTWTLPYNDTSGALQVILGPSFGTQAGTVVSNVTQSGTTLQATGDYSAGPCYIGRQYAKRYRFSTQYQREYVKGGGSSTVVANLDSRLQLNKMSVVFEQTGYIRAEVQATARAKASYVFAGHNAGLANAIAGQVSIANGTFTFPVLSKNDQVTVDLVNDTFLPSSLQSAEWQGKFYTPSQRQ